MSGATGKCFTCLKTDSNKYYEIHNLDTDAISYYDKLKACVTTELVEFDHMEICDTCITDLRVSYKFHKTVTASQEVLRQQQCVTIQIEDADDEIGSLLIINKNTNVPDERNETENDPLTLENNESLSLDENEDIASIAEKVARQLNSERNKKVWEFKQRQISNKVAKGQQSDVKMDVDVELKPEKTVHPCPHCKKQFTEEWKLKRHLSVVHKEIQRHICNYCDKEFKYYNFLLEHLPTHTGEQKYSCPVCNKKFTRRTSKRRHLRLHERDSDQKTKYAYVCSICGLGCSRESSLSQHMAVKHENIILIVE